VGQEYLLSAFTAALLGATSVRPGRVNVWGTILAVAVLAVTVAGLNQMGAPFFVEPIFNGAMLILAVGLAVTAASGARSSEGRPRACRAHPLRSPQTSEQVAMLALWAR
jgi:ribose/xylose/arabinose/galactoside ABC-type transport system permease subunit